MASTKKSLTSRSKTTKSRPTSTSALAQPCPSETSAVLSSFSPDGTLFALTTLAVDKHRIRIYNTASSRTTSEYTVDSGRVTVLSWSTLSPEPSSVESHSPSKKRKKTRSEDATLNSDADKEVTVLVVGLSDGTVVFYSPSHSKVIRTLSHPTSTTPILAITSCFPGKSAAWISSADSTIRLWDIQKNVILRSWKNDDHIPSTSLSIRPTTGDDQTDLLVAHHHIRLLEITAADSNSAQKPKQAASFTGHASPIKTLLWSNLETRSKTFFSIAEGDRFIYVWNADGASSNEKSIASMSLDSDVRILQLDTSDSVNETLIALSTSGKLSFTPVPAEFPRGGDKTLKIPTLVSRSTLSTAFKVDQQDQKVIDFIPVGTEKGVIRVVRLVNGVRPVFDMIRYIDDNGNYITTPKLDEINEESLDEKSQLIPNKRYTESTSLTVGSGFDMGQDQANDDVDDSHLDGSLQVDLAELSLGQRLTAVNEVDVGQHSESDDDDGAAGSGQQRKISKKQSKTEVSVIPANSLTRTLIQALHSSDSRLLEMCLTHSDPVLIRNTVRRLPPQLAIPLITACVDRLGRGARAANMKGGGGGTSSQRGMGLLTWLKTVLAIHTGHLMTIPDLVARLSGLHATLTSRLSLHDSLLSLSGRLDMVLSQVETRASTAPTPVAALGNKVGKAKKESIVKRYIEGETDSGEEDANMDVQVEVGSDDEGSIEDIELGGDSASEESNEDDDSDNEDDPMSKFIDDEAEEEFSDEEDEDESE